MIDVSVSGHYVGDCRELLKQLPDACVQTCVTSPPYLWLRDYGVDGQIGNESSLRDYIESLVAVFAEVRRVLRADGTLWLNLGDSYAGARGGEQGQTGLLADRSASKQRCRVKNRTTVADGLKPKDMIGVPWRAAFALQADGWWLRDDIIWHKPNPMPSSIDDRTTKAHEYVFLLSKSARYFYDASAIAEPAVEAGRAVLLGDKSFAKRQADGAGRKNPREGEDEYLVPPTRNCRSVWTIATQPYDGAHFATMPFALAERCVLAAAPTDGLVLDPFAGSGTTLAAAEKHGRRWIGFDINPAYEALQKERTAQRSLVLGGGER